MTPVQRTVLVYILAGGVWILFSDNLLSRFVTSPDAFARLSIIKGLVYIVITAAFLYWQLRVEKHMQRRLEEQYQQIFEVLPDSLLIIGQDGQIRGANHTTVDRYGYSLDELLSFKVDDLSSPALRNHTLGLMEYITSHNGDTFEWMQRCKDGRLVDVEIRVQPGSWHGEDCLLASIRDISERKRMERALAESEQRYSTLVEQSPFGIMVLQDQKIAFVNRSVVHAFGAKSRSELVGIEIQRFLPEGKRENHLKLVQRVLQERLEIADEWDYLRLDGTLLPARVSMIPFTYNGYPAIVVNVVDILERRRIEAEQAKTARQRDATLKRMQLMLDHMPAGCSLHDRDGRISVWNLAAEKIFGYSASDAIGKTPFDIIVPETARDHVESIFKSMTKGDLYANGVNENITRDGRIILCEWHNTPLYDESGSVTGFLSMVLDVTDRQAKENEIHRHVERLESLQEVSHAMTASLDLGITLDVLLGHALHQLNVDAAAILLFEPHLQTFTFTRGRGFRTHMQEGAHIPLRQGFAGRVLKTREMQILSPIPAPDSGEIRPLYTSEGFETYIGVPLIAKSQVKGVLEIYHRSPIAAEEAWLDYLQLLAKQAALAIDNIQLFENLQRANTELAAASDGTIEGLARALDLRDKETEGHSRRVTEITLRLAREMSVPDSELIHIYRGALLHDIGKMGVTDAILHKEGPLNENEWRLMKQHPVFAYDLLSSIPYLRNATDIPYSHHEKWNGTGYPQGLAGPLIPLAARIFAVVDVWDALSSKRSYRAAWEKDTVVNYLREEAGVHFDPQVVAIFLRMIGS